MESIGLIAFLGTVSTVALGILSIFRRWRPYASFVLGASVLVGLSVARQVTEGKTSVLEIWVTCFFIMLGVQVLLAPVALVTFLFMQTKKP